MMARPWGPDEDAVLRTRYGRDEAKAIARDLPGRNGWAVMKRARRLGLSARRRWTLVDDRRLRALWETTDSLRSIAASLSRTEVVTYWRAQQLGLPLGVPAGYEYLTAAATRTGYATNQLRAILGWAGVGLYRVRGRPSKRRGRQGGKRQRFHYCEPFDVDEAVARWLGTEPVEAAARARDLVGDTLRSWLRAAGVVEDKRPRQHWRVETRVIDRVVAERAGIVSLSEAARRVRVDRVTLARRLRQLGVTRPAGWRWPVRVEDAERAAGLARRRKHVRSA